MPPATGAETGTGSSRSSLNQSPFSPGSSRQEEEERLEAERDRKADRCGNPKCFCMTTSIEKDAMFVSGSSSASSGEPRTRIFPTGATRDVGEDKLCYEGFFSPFVLERRAQYMHRHRSQTDGSIRSADNWQKGIPLSVYADSTMRHVVEFWAWIRGREVKPLLPRDPQDIEEVLCAILFNAEGALLEVLRMRRKAPPASSWQGSDRVSYR